MTKKEYKKALELGLKLCTDDFYFTSQDDKGIFTSRYFTMKDHDKKKIVETAKAICKREKTKLINAMGYIDFESASMPLILFSGDEYEERYKMANWLECHLKKNHII